MAWVVGQVVYFIRCGFEVVQIELRAVDIGIDGALAVVFFAAFDRR